MLLRFFLLPLWVAASAPAVAEVASESLEMKTSQQEPRLWRTADDLPGNRVQAIAQSGDGYLWVGTAYGLARFDGFRFSVFDPGSLGVANLGNVILETGPENTVWIGTERGEVLYWKDGKFTGCLPRADTSDAVWSIYPEGAESATILKKEGIWRWSRRSGARLLPNTGPLEVSTGKQGIFSPRTARDASGELYFFSLRKCLRLLGDTVEPVLPPREGIQAEQLWDACTGADGTTWLLSDREILWRDPAKRWTALPPLPEPGWGGNILGSCPDGSIWLQMNGRLRRASRAGWQLDAGVWPPKGLVSPAYTDPRGRLWTALSTGALDCRFPDGAVRSFQGSVTSPERKISRFFMDREGNLWAGTDDSGLVCWNAEQIARLEGAAVPVSALAEPEVHLETCRLGEKEASFPFPPGGLTAPPGTARMEFRHTAILLGAPDSVRFRYRLLGLEESWRETSLRQVSYEAVPPGAYQFELQAKRPGGTWSGAPSLLLTMQAHFWQTGWFRMLAPSTALAAAGMGGWLISRGRSARRLKMLELEKARSSERLRLARDLHDDLGSRLTHLALLADLAGDEPKHDAQTLDTLRNGLRHAIGSLDAIVWTVDPRRDTLPDLAEYLTATLTGFFTAAGISCGVERADALPTLRVPSDHRHHLLLAVREAAQNILKHAAATRVVLQWSFDAPRFRFSLADNGCGFDPAESQGTGDGLRNMRERLAACGGALEISSAPGEGSRLVFTIAIAESSSSSPSSSS